MTSKEALKEIKDFKVVRLHETSLPDMTFPIAEYFKEQTSIIERDLNKLGQIEDLEEELGLSAYKILERIKEKRGK